MLFYKQLVTNWSKRIEQKYFGLWLFAENLIKWKIRQSVLLFRSSYFCFCLKHPVKFSMIRTSYFNFHMICEMCSRPRGEIRTKWCSSYSNCASDSDPSIFEVAHIRAKRKFQTLRYLQTYWEKISFSLHSGGSYLQEPS